MLQQIHYWLNYNERTNHNFRDGFYWTYNSYKDWQKTFPWWTERTVKKIIRELEKKDVLISTDQFNDSKMNKTKWYRIDYLILRTMVQKRTPIGKSLPHGEGKVAPIVTVDSVATQKQKSDQKLPSETIHKTNNYTDEFFNTFWDNYPRKVDKKQALACWKARVKSGVSPNDMICAAKNYAEACKSGQVAEKFIKHPKTFIGSNNSIDEWLNVEAVKTTPSPAPPPPEENWYERAINHVITKEEIDREKEESDAQFVAAMADLARWAKERRKPE